MKHDTAELGGRATEWSNVPMLLILVCIALGYLAYCLCFPFEENPNA